jgi:hypothetical protein
VVIEGVLEDTDLDPFSTFILLTPQHFENYVDIPELELEEVTFI